MSLGGFAQSCVNPLETIKVRLQNEGNAVVKKYKTFSNTFQLIFKEEGVNGLWKGTFPAIIRELVQKQYKNSTNTVLAQY